MNWAAALGRHWKKDKEKPKPLKVEASCEIGDLAHAIVDRTGKTFSEVETALFYCYLWPQESKTYITTQFGGIDTEIDWINKVLTDILSELNLEGLYITLEI